MEWFETVFRAGVLAYLDGIETHGYIESAYNPEQNDYPGRLARLRALMRQYNNGRELPIYITEAGRPGLVGAKVVPLEQAQHVVRMAIVCKGEGVRVFLPFYGIDYDRPGQFGFLFNKEVDGNPWGTRRCCPKPLVNAMAACALALEGAEPLGRLLGLGDEVWAYRFQRAGQSIVAAWTTGPAREAKLPVTGAAARVLDFEGHEQAVTPRDGAVTVTVSESPVYLLAP